MNDRCDSKISLTTLSVIGFLVSLQLGFTTFLDSSYLSKALASHVAEPEKSVGYIFSAAALIALFFFLAAPHLLRKFGNTRVALFAAISLPLFLFALANPMNLPITVLTYLFVTLCSTILFSSLDIYISQCVSEAKMGISHGIFFAACSLGFMLSPAIGGLIATVYSMSFVYFTAALVALPIPILLLPLLRAFSDPIYDAVPLFIGKELHESAPDLFPVFSSQFALHTFYIMMTIYVPLYFVQQIGFTYENFAYIITFALAAFVILPAPLGWLADRYLGEKKMIITGMFIMGGTLIAIPLVAQAPHTLSFWMFMLILSRIGAALTESMSDSFFFKKIEHQHPSLIAFYRRARPLSLLIIPLLSAALLSLHILSMSQLLIFMGITIVAAIAITSKLVDTK